MNTDDIKDRQYFFYFVFCFFSLFFSFAFLPYTSFSSACIFFYRACIDHSKKRYKSLHNLLIINTYPLLACIF